MSALSSQEQLMIISILLRQLLAWFVLSGITFTFVASAVIEKLLDILRMPLQRKLMVACLGP